MQYVAALIRLAIVAIWVSLMYNHAMQTPPFCSGLAFVLIGLSLCLNRIMAVKWTPCLLSCIKKKWEKTDCCSK